MDYMAHLVKPLRKEVETMRILVMCLLAILCVDCAQAHGGDDLRYFDLGLKSSVINKKINYVH